MLRLTVVIPTYNEADNLPAMAAELWALPIPELRILVVDDASPDGTGELADELASRQPNRISVIHRQEKLGLGSAYITGFKAAINAGAQAVAQMDADFSHSPSYLPEFMRKLDQIDPYDHPRGIHNVNLPSDQYINATQVNFTSIQTGAHGTLSGLDKALAHHRTTLDWIERCRQRGRRTLVINFDEGRPEEDHRAWWSAYMAGGVWEAHVLEPYDRPMSAWEPVWTQLGGTRAFMESLPFWQMESHDEVVKEGKAFCLAKPGEVYALYLPTGGSVTVSLPANKSFDIAWWNPANGQDGSFQDGGQVNGGLRRFTPPTAGDWALRIRHSQDRIPES